MAVKPDQIAITSPCPITLDRSGVSAKDRAMFCAHCSKDVHILSHMTEYEARRFMASRAGEDICVSYGIKKDGSIRFRSEPELASLVPASALLRNRPTPRRLGRFATLGATAMLAACTAHGEPQVVGEVTVADNLPVVQTPVIPDAPCDPQDDLLVDGGMRAEPIDEMVEGGLEAAPIDPPPMKRGGLRAIPVEPEPVPVAGGLRAVPIEDGFAPPPPETPSK